MDGLDVQRFISDQRSKLSQEKSRLFENESRSPRGIIPSGSQMSKKSELLRRERHAEYQDFLESRKKAPRSIAEVRREMAQEREQEIHNSQSTTNTNTSTNRQTQGQMDYDLLRNRKREEERQYRGATYYDNSRGREEEGEYRSTRRRWNDEAPPPPPHPSSTTHQRVRFDERGGEGGSEITNRGYSRGWEDEERDLMTWARGGGGSRSKNRNGDSRYRQERARARTPPEVESPRKRIDQDAQNKAKMRSISAPSVQGGTGNGGVFALGLGGREEDNAETKRNKQREYAEMLRTQIKEKEEAKERERAKEEMMEVRDAEDEKPSSLRSRRSVSQKSTHDEREVHHHKERERSPPPRRRDIEHYAPYQPPPSRFNDQPPYYGPPPNWDSHYYPYYPQRPPPRGDPNFNYYPPDPYHNPYYHPSHRFPPPPPPPHMRGENPYFPPPRREIVHGPPRRQWEDYEDEYSTKASRKREEPKRNRDLSSRDKRNPVDTSPIHGGGGGSGQRGVVMDKASYRAELTRQMKEKKENELKAKLKREMEDSKKEAEVYDPFGKGGCGAPVRDQHGNLVADLKQMRKINQERLNLSTSPSHRPASSGGGGGGDSDLPSDSPRTIFTYDKVDQEVQKQAGHMTYRDFLRQQVEEKERKKEEEKRQQMMEEQKELERLEKERKKLEEDFKRERERERQREEEAKRKNEQLKQEAEEKKRQAALKAEEEQRREAEQERQLAEARLRALAERMAQPLPQQQRRAYSPPIPTLRNKDNYQNPNVNPVPSATVAVTAHEQSLTTVAQEGPTVFRSTSPPVPAVLKKMAQEQQAAQNEPKADGAAPQTQIAATRVGTNSPPLQTQRQPSSLLLPAATSHRGPPRDHHAQQPPLPQTSTTAAAGMTIQPAGSATAIPSTGDQPSDILKQLAAMRMHLQSELAKKDALHVQQQQRSDHHGGGVYHHHGERGGGGVQQKAPKIAGPRIARPKDSATMSALNQFTHLKYTNPSRGDFVNRYPDVPDTESVLELQQDALLRHQERQLASLKAGKEGGKRLGGGGGGGGGQRVKQRGHHQNFLFDGDPLTSDSLSLPLGDKSDSFQLQQGHMTTAAMATATGGGATKVSSDYPPPPVGRRRQWGDEGRGHQEGGGGRRGRVPSPGGQSQFSVTTFDVDSMAMRNDERARRLDAILNAGTSGGSGSTNYLPQRRGGGGVQGQQHFKTHQEDPQTILHDFLRRTDHGGGRGGGGSRQSERSLDCETDYQRISSPHS